MKRLSIVLAAALAAVALAGCGGSDTASLDASGNATISSADFDAWKSAAAAAPGLKCTHARLVYPDTGEAVANADQAGKIKSKQTPSFQCITLPRLAWAFQRKNAAEAKSTSDAATVTKGVPGVKIVDAPSSAPDGATCTQTTRPKQYTCYVAWHNLALMAASQKTLDQAGELLSGMLATVQKVYGQS